MSKVLYITYINMEETDSGSMLRPQKIYQAFLEEKHKVKVLKGKASKKNKKKRIENIKEIKKWLKYNKPDYCYIEAPPSDPIIFKEDRRLIKEIHKRNIKIGYFYRDAYYKLGKEYLEIMKGRLSKEYIKYLYYKLLFWRDEQFLKNNVDIVYFPSKSMSKYFQFKDMRILQPAGEIIGYHNKNKDCIIYVGGISERYGINLLLESMEIVNQIQNVNLILVCRQEEMIKIPKKYLMAKWLKIYHKSGQQELKSLYEEAKIAVLPLIPNVYNNFAISVKLYEYMSYGLPIVSTNTIEMKKIIEKYDIGIITEENTEQYAEAILKLYNDEERIKEMSQNCETALRKENLWVHRVEKIDNDLKI